MGWTVIIAIFPMISIFKELGALSSLLWLLAGGIFYSIGGLIYGFKWFPIKNAYFGFHEMFHIFVMLGSLCHYWFMLHYLLYI